MQILCGLMYQRLALGPYRMVHVLPSLGRRPPAFDRGLQIVKGQQIEIPIRQRDMFVELGVLIVGWRS